ncbi:hypothetical protein SFRURICE_003591, partial [Spodoptera frugiperda]
MGYTRIFSCIVDAFTNIRVHIHIRPEATNCESYTKNCSVRESNPATRCAARLPSNHTNRRCRGADGSPCYPVAFHRKDQLCSQCVNLYVCKRTHDTGENPRSGQRLKKIAHLKTKHVVVAQNGAGNSATASAAVEWRDRVETYSLLNLSCILAIAVYFLWKSCKTRYGRYMRRELQELPTMA